MTRRISFVLVGAALALATVPVSAAAQATAQRQQSVRFLLASNGAPPVALDVGRTPVLRQRLTLDLEGVTVREALTAISERARLVLWYTDDVIVADRRVNLRADEITVAAALTDVLVDAGVDVVFNRDGSAVIVKRLASVALVQVGTVAGRVTDSISREGIGGVTIAVEGTRLSTTTAADGGYAIRGVPAGTRTITARRLGFVRQSRAVTVADNESTTVDFVLVQAPTTLTEVVTTVTGDRRRVELGHVVGRINADSVVRAAPVSSVSELLNGRVAGVQIHTYQGTVGGEASIRVRSPNTIALNRDPIVIVDGIRHTSTPSERIGLSQINYVEPTSPLNDLNPNEIESIEIVKGPSAATLYGTDAANGVVVITTKRGAVGPPRMRVYSKHTTTVVPGREYPGQYWGWQTLGGAPAATTNCALNQVASGACTQDSISVYANPLGESQLTIFEAAPRSEYGVNLMGGLSALRYFLAADLEQATGPLRMPPVVADSLRSVRAVTELPDEQTKPNAFSKMNLRLNTTIGLGTDAEVFLSSGYTRRSTRTLGYGSATPYDQAFEARLPGQQYGDFGGPADWFSSTSTESVSRFFASATGRWSPAHWLLTRVTGGIDISNSTRASLARQGEARNRGFGSGEVADDRGRQLAGTGELTTTANFSFGPLASRTSVGAQYVRTVNDVLGSAGTDLPAGGSSIGEAVTVRATQTYREQVTLGGYVEHMLSLNERLFLTGALRADGASTFGRDYDVASYPKASVSWLVSEEPIVPNLPLVDEVRLRYAFGVSGQQPLPEWARPGYEVRQTWVGGMPVNSYRVTTVGNPQLRPERVSEHEFGFDASALTNRITMGLTWFRRSTIDQIVNFDLPPGLRSIKTNLGRTTGRGFEAELSGRVVALQRVSWDFGLQHSFYRTTLDDLGGAAPNISANGGWVEGYPLGARFMRPLLGYDDANGDGIIASTELQWGDSAIFVGESTPPRTLTLTSTLGLFNRLRLSALAERRSGFVQMNQLGRLLCGNRRCRGAVDRNAPLAEQAQAVAAYTNFVYRWLEPGDYTRLREVALSLDVPSRVVQALRVKSGTISLQGRNLALWTSYSGIDPESAMLGIPQGRSLALRMDLGF